ncbi:signal peptidase I [Streptococcus cameli]
MVKRELFERIGLLIFLIVGLLVLRIWFFEPVRINDQMANAYLGNSDLVIAVKNPEINYGEFLVYEVDGKEYAGRVIAMAEDQVTYMDDVLYRNEEVVHETYLDKVHTQDYFTEDLTIDSLTQGAFQSVPKKHYLILNDNRLDKRDSREFGLISEEQIVGKLAFRVTPLEQFGFIETGLAQ